jgi:hypothetical protein
MDGLNMEKLKLPSLTARRASSAVWTGANRTEGWRKQVNDEQRRRAVEILTLFGLNKIYTDDPMPRVEGALEIMNGRGTH